MDIKEYIQSGIIEQYVMGLASAEEAAELEKLRDEYPELKVAIVSFEQSLEEHLRTNEVIPPVHIKAALEKRLFDKDLSEKTTEENTFTTAFSKKSTPVYNIGSWKYLAAACIILLIASTALNFYFYSGYKSSKQQYEALLTERNTLQANNASYQQSLQMMQDTSMVHIEMKGMPGKEQNLAMLVWDPNTKYVYIYANDMQQAPAGKQYQLWAIVDGKPVNAGVIGNDCAGICKMKKIDRAEAFAVTLEKEGGNETPTVTEMYVMGKV